MSLVLLAESCKLLWWCWWFHLPNTLPFLSILFKLTLTISCNWLLKGFLSRVAFEIICQASRYISFCWTFVLRPDPVLEVGLLRRSQVVRLLLENLFRPKEPKIMFLVFSMPHFNSLNDWSKLNRFSQWILWSDLIWKQLQKLALTSFMSNLQICSWLKMQIKQWMCIQIRLPKLCKWKFSRFQEVRTKGYLLEELWSHCTSLVFFLVWWQLIPAFS